MYEFEEICSPIFFESENKNYPYWGKGSSFFISSNNSVYWLTARHAIENLKGLIDNLRVFAKEGSKISMPFDEKYTIASNLNEDNEWKDVLMLRVDLEDFDASGDASITAQDIDSGCCPASGLEETQRLFVIGYPAEKSEVNYELDKILTTRAILNAEYCGPSLDAYCHSLKILNSSNLSNLDGLSGSPVFILKTEQRENVEFIFPLLVGMVIRGTASSNILHFISSEIFSGMVNSIENNT
jgi:hypothetical protein